MRCINCDVDIQRLRRHTTSSLPNDLRAILTGWLSVEIPIDSNICHVCFELLNSNIAADGRLFGFTKLCVACGHSLRKARQRHTLERNHSMLQNLPQSHPALHQITNYACHSCWVRHERLLLQDPNRVVNEASLIPKHEPITMPASPQSTSEPAPEPAPDFTSEPEIYLPNYKRVANTSSHCVFEGCNFVQRLHVIPLLIKKFLIDKYKLYIPRSTRVCGTHLLLDSWNILMDNPNIYSYFAASQIEDMLTISKYQIFPTKYLCNRRLSKRYSLYKRRT